MKRLLHIFCIVIVIFLLWVVLAMIKSEITFDPNNISNISINGFGSIRLDTEDKDKIKEVVKYLDSIIYYKVSERETHNQSPEALVAMFNNDGKCIEQIAFYGDLVEYKETQYRVIPFMRYNSLEKLCNKLNEK